MREESAQTWKKTSRTQVDCRSTHGEETMIEQTLILVKPDGVERGIVGNILTRFEHAGLKFVGMKMMWVDKEFSKKHYAEHVEKPFYKGLEEFIVSGPVIAMVLEGLHAVSLVRKIVGATEPKSALPGTIRGDYAHHSYEFTDKKIAILSPCMLLLD